MWMEKVIRFQIAEASGCCLGFAYFLAIFNVAYKKGVCIDFYHHSMRPNNFIIYSCCCCCCYCYYCYHYYYYHQAREVFRRVMPSFVLKL